MNVNYIVYQEQVVILHAIMKSFILYTAAFKWLQFMDPAAHNVTW